MNNIRKYNDFSLFTKEHNKLVKKFNLNLIFLKNVKIPIIFLYEIIDILFKNNFKKFKNSDIILLTLVSISILSKENEDDVKFLFDELVNRNINGYVPIVKRTLISMKNLSNIILKNDGLVIKNIEQFLKYKFSIKVLNLIFSYISIFDIKMKDFNTWYISDHMNNESKKLIKYIKMNYV